MGNESLQSWIGREEVTDDVATAAPLAGLAATLDRAEGPGNAAPPGGHWLYFLTRALQSGLAPWSSSSCATKIWGPAARP